MSLGKPYPGPSTPVEAVEMAADIERVRLAIALLRGIGGMQWNNDKRVARIVTALMEEGLRMSNLLKKHLV